MSLSKNNNKGAQGVTEAKNIHLQKELNAQQREILKQIPEDIAKLLQEGTDDLARSGLASKALKAGEKAPLFSLPNALGKNIQLSEILRHGPVVISFYRGEWCPYCNLELQALQKSLKEIKALGASLIAISPQTPDHTLSTKEKYDLKFEVLSDQGNKVARTYNLVFTLPEKLKPIYKNWGGDLPGFNGEDSWELPLPATYLIDQKGIVRKAFVNVDYTKRFEPLEILESLRKIVKR